MYNKIERINFRSNSGVAEQGKINEGVSIIASSYMYEMENLVKKQIIDRQEVPYIFIPLA